MAAAATAGMICASSSDAFAQATTFADMSKNIVIATGNFQNLISTVCWIGGAGLGVAGIFKLKQHVDNPGQVPMKDGLIRLGAGGALLAFPFVMIGMAGSISNANTTKLQATNLKLDSTANTFT